MIVQFLIRMLIISLHNAQLDETLLKRKTKFPFKNISEKSKKEIEAHAVVKQFSIKRFSLLILNYYLLCVDEMFLDTKEKTERTGLSNSSINVL